LRRIESSGKSLEERGAPLFFLLLDVDQFSHFRNRLPFYWNNSKKAGLLPQVGSIRAVRG
jgi:hypothetical protein